jgi:hypothetical protein
MDEEIKYKMSEEDLFGLSEVREIEDLEYLTPEIKSPAITTKEATKEDYLDARHKLKYAIDAGLKAIQELGQVAKESDSVFAYNALANMMKSVSVLNKDLILIGEKINAMETNQQSEVSAAVVGNTINVTNNTVFAGTTADLDKLIKRQTLIMKAEEESRDKIIDVEDVT